MEIVGIKIDVAGGAVGETFKDNDLVFENTQKCSKLQRVRNLARVC